MGTSLNIQHDHAAAMHKIVAAIGCSQLEPSFSLVIPICYPRIINLQQIGVPSYLPAYAHDLVQAYYSSMSSIRSLVVNIRHHAIHHNSFFTQTFIPTLTPSPTGNPACSVLRSPVPSSRKLIQNSPLPLLATKLVPLPSCPCLILSRPRRPTSEIVTFGNHVSPPVHSSWRYTKKLANLLYFLPWRSSLGSLDQS